MSGNRAGGAELRPRGFSAWWIIACLICLVSNSAFAQSHKVTAAVQPAQVTVGDTVSYQVSVEITGAGQPSVAVPVVDPDTGLSTPSPAGSQSSVETYIENGSFRSIQKVIYNYLIRTSKEGKFTIPPSTVTLNGKTYDTDPVTVVVQALPKAADVPSELQGLVAAPSVAGNQELQRKLTGGIFVLPVLSKTNPYNGEQVRISYHLVIEPETLQASGLEPRTNLNGVNIPPMNEFISEELFPFPQDLKFQDRKIGGRLYLVAPVYEAVIASTKSGKLEIEPFQISMVFSQRGQQRQLPAPFANDPFFSSMNPLSIITGNSVQVIAQSPPLTLDVKPLPEAGKPADFGGAVGNLTISAAIDKTKARAYDETLNLKVKVQGEGNTDSLSPPPLPATPGFTVLGTPEMTTRGEKKDDKFISTKIFDYTLRPTTPGNQKFPPIAFSYFDPKDETYHTVETNPIAVEVMPGTHKAPPPVEPSEVDTPEPDQIVDEDLHYISEAPLPASSGNFRWLWSRAGLVFFMLPPGLLMGAALVAYGRKRAGEREADPRKTAAEASGLHLKEAESALGAGNYQKMVTDLSEGVRLYFASKFAISAAEVTIPEIEERLGMQGVPSSLVGGLTGVLEKCDAAQYAPTTISKLDAQDLFSDARRLLKELETYS